MKICAIGAGNVGCAYAAVLASQGADVTLFKTTSNAHDANFDQAASKRGLTLRLPDGSESFAPLTQATRDPRALDQEFDAVVVAVQTWGHRAAAELLAQNLRRAKLVLVAPGYMGSLYFWPALKDRVDVVAEGESPAFDARLEEPGAVRVYFRNVRDALAFLPRSKTMLGMRLARALVDEYRYARQSVVESALHNPNLILHTVGCVMSAARIENARGEFWMYREGFPPSVWRVVERLDEEKKAVLRAYGCRPISYLEACQFRNERDLASDPLETFRRYGREGGPKGPATLNARYLTEDVPNGLGLLRSLGSAAGIATPIADSLVELSGALLGRDFNAEARTIQRLGFRSGVELRRFIDEN